MVGRPSSRVCSGDRVVIFDGDLSQVGVVIETSVPTAGGRRYAHVRWRAGAPAERYPFSVLRVVFRPGRGW